MIFHRVASGAAEVHGWKMLRTASLQSLVPDMDNWAELQEAYLVDTDGKGFTIPAASSVGAPINSSAWQSSETPSRFQSMAMRLCLRLARYWFALRQVAGSSLGTASRNRHVSSRHIKVGDA